MSIEVAVPVLLSCAVVGMYFYLWLHPPSRRYVEHRKPDEERWRRLYPAEDGGFVREVLDAIGAAFGLRHGDEDRLEPTDRLVDIYRAAYPLRGGPDGLELETLWRELRRRFLVPDEALQNLGDMTVKDVITEALKAHSRPTRACS